jgi:hypothetical protein
MKPNRKETDMNQHNFTSEAIATNLAALNSLLRQVALLVQESCQYIESGNRHAAIGSIVGLDDTLQDAQALLRAVFALHRNGGRL